MEDNLQPLKLTLKELVAHYEGFLQACERKSTETRGTYQRALRDFLKWFPIDKRFLFRVRDVERYRRYLVERKELKDVSVATYMTALRRFCQYLIDVKILAANPAAHVVGGRRPSRHSRTFLSYDEIGALLGAVDRSPLQGMRDYALILLMLDCALSERECLLADIGDILETDGVWRIRVQGKGRSVKDESVTMTADAMAAIADYLQRRFPDSPPPADAPLFASMSNRTQGRRMTSRGMREAVSRWLRQSGVKGNRDRELTPFSLRHTAGLIMVDNGATIEEVMHRMRIEWQPTAQLYFRIRGKLGGNAQAAGNIEN
ncbi:MAG TPA: tyrosine-type recombinase/integrase [Candidatus Kapabacteria bacterium]|nr:tyrosine-type recombinase/integrase [Candidatus Kapabacteria bacterium]